MEAKEILSEYKCSKQSLGEILDVDPKSVEGTGLEALCLSNRELSVLRRHRYGEDFTLADLLRMNVEEFCLIRDFGIKGQEQVLLRLQAFMNQSMQSGSEQIAQLECEYKQKFEYVFVSLPHTIQVKKAVNFVKAYFMNNEKQHKEYMIAMAGTGTLSQFNNKICSESFLSYSKYVVIADFYKWLVFDVNEIAETLLIDVKRGTPENIIFAARAHGMSLQDALCEYGYTRNKLYGLTGTVANKFYKSLMNSAYDLFAAILAIRDNDQHSIYFEDLVSYIGIENAELIWYSLRRLKNKFRTELYRFCGYRENLEDRITTAVWFWE